MGFWIKLALSIAASLGGIGSIQFSVSVEFGNVPVKPPVEATQLGWSPDFDRQAYEALPELQIMGDSGDDHLHDNIRLYELVRAVNGGEDSQNIRQEIGDCVSQATDKACEHCLAAQIYFDKLDIPFIDFYAPYFYGVQRVLIGKGQLGNGDGSLVDWAARGVIDFGALPADTPGLKPYSGQIAKSWGINGPPREFIPTAQQFKIRNVARCKSANDVVLALANGYPIITGSQFGTTNLIVQDGRRVGPHDGKWSHSMPVVAYDGTATSGKRYFLFFNSWGKDAHGTPMQGEPAGSFWVDWESMEWVCNTGQVYAISNMQTFKKRNLDFDVLAAVVQRPSPIREEVYMDAFAIGVGLLIVAVVVWFTPKTSARLSMLLVLLAGMGSGGYAGEPGKRVNLKVLDQQQLNFNVLQVIEMEPAKPIQPGAGAGDEQKRPSLIVSIYKTDPCIPCETLLKNLGTGDHEIIIEYIDRDELPPDVMAIADRQGYPFAYCAKNRRYLGGDQIITLDNLKYLARQPVGPRLVPGLRVKR